MDPAREGVTLAPAHARIRIIDDESKSPPFLQGTGVKYNGVTHMSISMLQLTLY